MAKSKTYKSDALAAIHETVSDYYDAGVIGKQTMRRFDEACLTPVHAFTAEEIRKLREREQVSQAVFANHLNVTKDSVSQWERGAKRPAGPALKLLSLIEKRGLRGGCLDDGVVAAAALGRTRPIGEPMAKRRW